jgi:predicted enzyme related to lactoylglutathione lyase
MILEHVNLTVSDLQRSIDFYCTLFDFRVRWRSDAAAEKQEAHVGNDDMYIALFQAPQPGIAEVDYNRVGLNHFGIVVDNLDTYRERFYMNSVRRAGSTGAATRILAEHLCERWARERGIALTHINMYAVIETVTVETIANPEDRERRTNLVYKHGCGDHDPEEIALPISTPG